jgi:Ca2+-binding RTX toxin-like protein
MTIARIGAEFLVNTATTSSQGESSVTALADGRFVVTYTDYSASGGDTSSTAIRSRIFNADGTQSVPEFLVNTTTTGAQVQSSVTALADGRFVVTYTDTSESGGDLSFQAIRARIFNADGTQSVPEFLVNTTTTNGQVESSVTALADGRFVVTYTDDSQSGGDTSSTAIRARIFNADGTQSVPELLVNTTTTGIQYESSVTALADGRFVVTYTDNSQSGGDTSGYAVRARIFNADGTQSVPEFLVNTTTFDTQFQSSVASLADGRFIVTYTDVSRSGNDTSGGAIRARIFNADGTQAVTEFLVNTSTLNDQFQSSVAALADGRFVVTYTDGSQSGGDTTSLAIRARIFNADGTESIPEFLVNIATINAQLESSVTALADGRFVVTFSDNSFTNGDASDSAVRSDIFDPTRFDGTTGADVVTGGNFDDRYLGYGGEDVMSGRGGDDYLNGGDGSDTLNGDDGNDRLEGGNSADFLYGGTGDDLVYGGAGIDQLFGDAGNDNLNGGLGGDTLNGGAGFDFVWYSGATSGVYARLDGVAAASGEAVGDTFISIEGFVGSAFNDIFVGNNANGDYIDGLSGNDTIYGLGGNDTLLGGRGNDNLYGGTGGDTLNGGADFDFAWYTGAAAGVYARLDGVVAAGGEAVGDTFISIEGFIGSAFNDTFVGNNANGDYIDGQGGNDTIYGLGGNDSLLGGAGNDILFGGTGADRFQFNAAVNASTNVDTISDFVAGTDDIVLSQAIFTGIGSTLDANEFQIGGPNAVTDRICYNPGTGQLFFDADGNGTGSGLVLFATVTAGTALTLADFVMVA